MQGVCSVCRSKVEVVSAHGRIFHEMKEHGWDDEDVIREFGQSAHYLCEKHESFGQRCDGSGQIPEAILKDETS